MKMFVVLALAALAAAEPEADPQLLLGGIHGVHTPYTHVAPVSTYSSPLLRTLVNPVKSLIPAVRTVVPEVKTVLSTPVVSTYSQYPYGVGYPMTYGAHPYGVIAAPRTIVTNYQDSEHYTAEATPLGKALGEPSYVAKNGEVVHEVQKREAEADPALFYSGLTHTPFTGLTHTPSVYNTGMVRPINYANSAISPISYASSAIRPISYTSSMVKPIIPAVRTMIPEDKTVLSTPVVSTYSQYPYGVAHPYGVIAAPRTIVTNYQDSEHYTAEATPLGKALGEPSYVAKNGQVVHEVQKREAEADPALFYSGLTHTPFTGINSMYNTAGVINPFTSTYNTAAVNPIVYSGLTQTPFTGINSVYNTAALNPVVYNAGVVKALDHGVVATPFGAIHSSHVGKCLNNEGVEVSC